MANLWKRNVSKRFMRCSYFPDILGPCSEGRQAHRNKSKKEVLTMKNWQRYLILTGAAMSQTLSHQDIKQAIEILR